jgi:PLAT/LH2 domain-containing protein/glycerophosphoryl diester phosphodiesterase family protein
MHRRSGPPRRRQRPQRPLARRILIALHQVALEHPELALVVFDCKHRTATPELGAKLLDARVAHFFTAAGVERHCFGNGISFLNALLGPNVRPSLEHACTLRAATGAPRFPYPWTVDDARLMREYIRLGVDGIITNDVARLRAVVAEPEFRSTVRLASRADDPLAGPRAAYGLIVHTGDTPMAGTDANVTFTLSGAAGSNCVTVDTRWRARMERNDWNYVTLESEDLGPLHAITVQRDDQGNAPGWYLDRIVVESARYGVSLGARFACWIDGTAPVARPLT